MNFQNNLDFALQQDQADELNHFRARFNIPQKNGQKAIYFCGNSLGAQPKSARHHVEVEMLKWEKEAVEGHFRGEGQWYDFHKSLKKAYWDILGGKEEEVVVMNNLTVNLHLLMVTFYRPTQKHFKILMEGGAFPSDQYVVESQAKFHGFDPEEAIVEIFPREGEHTLRTEDIIHKIQELGGELALILFGGLNYYTGQVFDMPAITKAGHQVGAIVGFDLAHVAGNIPLKLHEWEVDFASWCTYKYMNSSPGGVSGVFIHEKHAQDTALPRFAGWWGYEEESRFQMTKGFKAIPNVDGWMLSNSPILLLAAHKASLDIFEEAGMSRLREKSKKLTAYLQFIIEDVCQQFDYKIEIITPQNPEVRGCQLSLLTSENGKLIFDELNAGGVIGDWREPNVIRLAPTPLYNTFTEIWQFGDILKNALQKVNITA